MKKVQKLINSKQFKEALDAAEKEIYKAAYVYAKCNQTAAAKLLGVARGTVIYKLKGWEQKL